MKRLTFSPPAVVVGVLLLAAAAEVGWVMKEHRRMVRILGVLEKRQQERVRLERSSPAPSVPNETALEAAVVTAENTLAAMQDKLLVPGPPETSSAADASLDEYVTLKVFVEETRTRLQKNGIAVRAGENFGFATYEQAGPEWRQLPVVKRQREAIRHLMEAVMAARPLGFTSLKRTTSLERPAAGFRAAAEDFFIMPKTLSLTREGVVETDGFRVEFYGNTSALRGFLNELARRDRPLFVRAVEVEPTEGKTKATALKADRSGGTILPQSQTFTITLEAPRPAGGEENRAKL